MQQSLIRIYPEIKGLIFDCDGTLADTMPIHIEAWENAFSAFNVTCPLDFLDKLKGLPEEKIVSLFNEHYSCNLNEKKVVQEKHKYFRARINRVKPIKPAVDVVKKYAQKLPMAVVSGGKRENVMLILKVIELEGFFDSIITADDEVEPKPSPAIFLETARRLGIKPEFCQVFEDGDMGLTAARDAGMVVTDIRQYL